MSNTLFSHPPRSGSRRVARIRILNEPQGNRPPRPPPLTTEWMCDEPYQNPIQYLNNPLRMCNEVIEKHDEIFCDRLKEEINFLMVVAGLFLAIVAAFTVESYKSLREDKQDTMSDLLVEVVRLLNDTNLRGQAKPPKPFMPNHHDIVVNQLWFMSMALSLTAVGFGTFCLQWISTFSRGSDLREMSVAAHKSLLLRQLRYEGMVRWHVHHAPEILLLIVQVSIGLFVSGLLYFLWNINHETTIPVFVVVGLAGVIFSIMNSLPFLQSIAAILIPATPNFSHCPYKSPASWFILNAGNLFAFILGMFLIEPPATPIDTLDMPLENSTNVIGRIRMWLESLPTPFTTDLRWREHDSIGVCLRETWTSAGSRLHYFELGLSSALDELIYDPNAEDIISNCLRDLQPVFTSARDWEMFSKRDLSFEEKGFLDGNFRLLLYLLPHHLRSTSRQLEYANKIRVDFLNALILQHLAQHNAKFNHILFRLRVELYIRIKNSAQVIKCPGNDTGERFSSSLQCPLNHQHDVAELDSELQFQFLSCVKHLICIRRFNDYDILSAAAIVLLQTSAASAEIQDLGDIPRADSPAQEEQEVNSPDQGPFENIPGNPGGYERASSLRNRLDRGRSEFVGHDSNTKDTSFINLCSQVLELLSGLDIGDFQDIDFYIELRERLRLPVIPRFDREKT